MGKTIGVLAVTAAAISVTACTSYPREPRYSTRADPDAWNAPGSAYPSAQGQTPGQPAPHEEAPPPRTAPVDSIEGGALPSTGNPGGLGPIAASSSQTTGGVTGARSGASAYVVQQGDTLSGVARRFRTPVRTLIDLNGLGADGGVRSGQRITLPPGAVDTGVDPYATGPAPTPVPGGLLPVAPAVTPAPAPPAPRPVPPAPATPAPSNSGASNTALAFQWPLRGDIVRRFGPVGLGERNNGINIAASAGTTVVASATGRVAYVGDALPGQGLTVVIMHRDGWRTVYGHLGSAAVDDGDDVRAGQPVGVVGTTAGDGRPSVHFEMRRMQGDNPQAVDPLTVLPR